MYPCTNLMRSLIMILNYPLILQSQRLLKFPGKIIPLLKNKFVGDQESVHQHIPTS
jgi:hypothetical protein